MFPLERSVESWYGPVFDPANEYSYPTWASSVFIAANTDTSIPQPRATLTRETVRKTWFSGAFTYFIPLGDDIISKVIRFEQRAQKLGGPLPTPDQVWAVAPWSWAVDWFTNMGDVITNMSDSRFYDLIIRYGYIMETTTVKDTYTCDPVHLLDGTVVTFPPLTFVTTTKVRRKANPFGFGVTWEGLSSFQLSILAALGITRHR
jgi:hypothetical protein